MADTFRFSALAGNVLFENDIVTVSNDEGLSVQVSLEEWELLNEKLRFSDTVDYERGETPMTVFQFQSFIKMIRELKSLNIENEQLKKMLNR